jgi:hypothetical protein
MTTAAETFLRKAIPSASMHGPGWDLLLAVVGTTEQKNWDLAEAVEKQLFEATAVGKYLERLGSRSGIEKPKRVGMQDDSFRDLLVAMGASQVTPESFLAVLEVYYGLQATHANVVSAAAEPFNLADGVTLDLMVDGVDQVTASSGRPTSRTRPLPRPSRSRRY